MDDFDTSFSKNFEEILNNIASVKVSISHLTLQLKTLENQEQTIKNI